MCKCSSPRAYAALSISLLMKSCFIKMSPVLLLSFCLTILSTIPGFGTIEVNLTNDTTEGIATCADLQPASLANHPVTLHLALKGSDLTHTVVNFTAEDIFGQPVDWKNTESLSPASDGTAVIDVVFPPPSPGYFRVHAQVEAGDEKATASTDFGVVAAPYPGVRPDSFFASNTSSFKTGADLDLLQAIGMGNRASQLLSATHGQGSSDPAARGRQCRWISLPMTSVGQRQGP